MIPRGVAKTQKVTKLIGTEIEKAQVVHLTEMMNRVNKILRKMRKEIIRLNVELFKFNKVNRKRDIFMDGTSIDWEVIAKVLGADQTTTITGGDIATDSCIITRNMKADDQELVKVFNWENSKEYNIGEYFSVKQFFKYSDDGGISRKTIEIKAFDTQTNVFIVNYLAQKQEWKITLDLIRDLFKSKTGRFVSDFY